MRKSLTTPLSYWDIPDDDHKLSTADMQLLRDIKFETGSPLARIISIAIKEWLQKNCYKKNGKYNYLLKEKP